MNATIVVALIHAAVGTSAFEQQCEFSALAVQQIEPAAEVRCLPVRTDGELLLLQRLYGIAPDDALEPVPMTAEAVAKMRDKPRADAALDALINDEEK
jgi:hypothetical protein